MNKLRVTGESKNLLFCGYGCSKIRHILEVLKFLPMHCIFFESNISHSLREIPILMFWGSDSIIHEQVIGNEIDLRVVNICWRNVPRSFESNNDVGQTRIIAGI